MNLAGNDDGNHSDRSDTNSNTHDDTEEDDDDDDGFELGEKQTDDKEMDLQDCIDALEQVPDTYLSQFYDSYDQNNKNTHNAHTTYNSPGNIALMMSEHVQHDAHLSLSSASPLSVDVMSPNPGATGGGAGGDGSLLGSSASNISQAPSSTTSPLLDADDDLLYSVGLLTADNVPRTQDQQQQLQQQLSEQSHTISDQLYIYSALEQWIVHPELIHTQIHDPIVYHHYTSSSLSTAMLDSLLVGGVGEADNDVTVRTDLLNEDDDVFDGQNADDLLLRYWFGCRIRIC